MTETAFDYRDYLPRKTDKPDSPESWRIENETSFVKNGVEYFVVLSEIGLVLFYSNHINDMFCWVRIPITFDCKQVDKENLTARPPIKKPRPMTVEEVWAKHLEGALFQSGVSGIELIQRTISCVYMNEDTVLLSDDEWHHLSELSYTLDLGKTWHKCEVVD